MPAVFTGRDRVGTKARTHGPFFDHGHGCRQCARSEEHRKIVGALDREVARDLPGSTQNGLVDHRRRNDLIVEDNGKRKPDILLGHLAETLGALGIEAERHDRFVGALVEPGLRIHEVFTRYQFASLDQVRNWRVVGGIEDFGGRRRSAVERLVNRHRSIHQSERKFGDLVQDALQTLRIVKSRNLDENPVIALALDDRLGRSQFIDTPANNFRSIV